VGRASKELPHAPYQRIAALSVPDGSLGQTVYVLLSRDGLTMTVSADTEEP
jgi:hypothetical protein